MSEVKLYHGDCLVEMNKIADKSVDLILTDPPYGTTACKWDSIIPFDKMWEQLNRIIKDNGAIVLFGSEPFSSALRMSNVKNYRYDWVWDKGRGFGFANANKMPMKSHEIISVFYKHLPTYNPQKTKGKPYAIKGGIRNKGSKLLSGNKEYNSKSRANIASFVRSTCHNSGDRFPLTVLNYKKDSDSLHPTQKPIVLLEYLIKTYTNKNETVLDFTMGSGSTGIACINTNRNFIGIELDDNYFKIAEDRINKVKESIFDL